MPENLICPYPGLRPFNEDEAIFFKGREEHIELIVKQLEEKKFLMLTGASGDGKSSLVYAGVIPNARAGFFKAKFNNWIVADFRPEREPLLNMSTAIDTHLRINDVNRVEKELSYGFSSLIDLYKSSSYWIDQQKDSFKVLTPDERKKEKRKGANLLILVDQFEEFFTNPENYMNGRASIESQAVINSLLETTRLAIEQDLPIYIICTMRSDYIGQCASFRDLPEYIGYSQFFVPRLKRKEIYQVIEEPALLNGNKISKRLVEMLINEMTDGIDQLPVLQHALNQIWLQADRGRTEMDIIHFAKINGIPKNQLAEKDKEEFETWFDTLPEFKKMFFKESSLGDVLDAHANELYETSNKGIEGMISTADAKLIVKTTFKSLTKIDESRAVRNRMTLEEVTQIINRPHITVKIVSHILYTFRMQGNTFIKPFILDEFSKKDLAPTTVLDITHESLIRNWQKLNYWAKQEHEHLLTWQDFYKQLKRWIESDKSSGYLLPIGPLTFFETWFNKVKINKYWLARYDDREIPKEQKLQEAEEILSNTRQFIKRSARRLFFSRTVLKYGADKLIAVFGLALFIFSCTYFYFDFRTKQNDYIINDIQEKGWDLLKSRYVKNKVKADYILAYERLNPNTYKDLLKSISGDSAQIDVVREMFASCLGYQGDKKLNEENNPLVGNLFLEQLNLIENKKVFESNASLTRNINNILGVVYGHLVLKRIGFPINDNGAYKAFCNNTSAAFINLVKDSSHLKKINTDQFNKFLQIIPEVVDYDASKLLKITDLLSPFKDESKKTFNILFSKEKVAAQNWNENLTHGGGYYQMANLYALCGRFNELNRSFDSILFYNKNFLNITDGYSYNRFFYDLVITNQLYSKEGLDFIKKVAAKRNIKRSFPIEVMMLNDLLIDKDDISLWTIKRFTVPKTFFSFPWRLQIQGERINYPQLNNLAESIISKFLVNSDLEQDEKNFMTALLYKAKAFTNNKKNNFDAKLIDDNLTKSVHYYNKVSEKYSKDYMDLGEGGDVKSARRSKVYKYGGLVSLTNVWDPFDEDNLREFKDKGAFIDYITKNNNLVNFYCKTEEDAETFNSFLINYCYILNLNNKDEKVINLEPFEKALSENRLHNKTDKNTLLAFITAYYHSRRQDELAGTYAKKINKTEFLNKEKIDKDNNGRKYYKLAKGLLNYYFSQPFNPLLDPETGKNFDGMPYEEKILNFDTAFAILKAFPDEFQKRNVLLANLDSLQRGKKHVLSIVLMDTLLNGYIVRSSKFGNKFFEILGRLSTADADRIALVLLKDRSEKVKPECLSFLVSGKAQEGYYHQAISLIPDYISTASQLSLYTTILKSEIKNRKVKQLDGWSAMDSNEIELTDWQNTGYERGDNENWWEE